MPDIEFEGGIQGLAMFVDELEARGLEPSYEPPLEGRDTGTVLGAISLVIAVKNDAEVRALAAAAFRKVKARWPRTTAKLDGDDDYLPS